MLKLKYGLIFIPFVLLAFVLIKNEGDVSEFETGEKHKGVCWVGGDSIVSSNLDSLIINNVTWISQTPFAWQRGHNSPKIGYDNSRAWWGERDAGLIRTTELAHKQGIKVMLKPHIWLSKAEGKWRSDIAMDSEDDWKNWFAVYEEMILYYARVAEKGKMDALCIGTELSTTSRNHPEKWRAIIKKIREIYPGELTYAANFHNEYDKITFWDDLDYIGIQAYFPIATKNNPDLKSLKKSWTKISKKLEKVSKKYGKKIVFTEVGYKNTEDAAIKPWLWPRDLDIDQIKLSEKVQADCYEAMFSTLWDKKWFGGLYIWKWFHGNHERPYKEYVESRKERWAKRAKERGRKMRPSIDFTPQGMQAEQVMRKYYSE